MPRFLVYYGRKRILFNIVITVVLLACAISSILVGDDFYRSTAVVGDKYAAGGSYDAFVPCFYETGDTFSQAFTPQRSKLDAIEIRFLNAVRTSDHSIQEFSILNSSGIVLWSEQVDTSTIKDWDYYRIEPEVQFRKGAAYTLKVTCVDARGNYMISAFLSEQNLEENGLLTYKDTPLDGALDIVYEYHPLRIGNVIAAALITVWGLLLTWIKAEFLHKSFINWYISLPVTAVIMLWVTEILSNNQLSAMSIPAAFVNFVLIFGFMLLLMAVLNHSAVSGIAISAVLLILAMVNHFTLLYRGTVLLPTDIVYSSGTAMNVLSQYNLSVDGEIMISLAAFLTLCLFLIKTDMKCGKRGRFVVSFLLIICMGFNALMVVSPRAAARMQVSVSHWDQTSQSHSIGFLQNMVGNIRYLILRAPSGYSEEKAINILEQQAWEDDTKATNVENPNIVLVMAESYADLGNLGYLVTNEDYLENYHGLSEEKNAKSGYCVVPVYGAGTCCSEFEFLTGWSMSFLGAGIAPYQQYIHRDTPSVATEVMEQGDYAGYAFHNGNANNWGRDEAYPRLGFDSFISMEDPVFEGTAMYRGWSADQALVDQMVRIFDEEERILEFAVTIQCHGGYDIEGFESTVQVENLATDYPDVNQYLTSMKSADEAIGNLIESIRTSGEPTIVVLFGDHLPNLDSQFYSELTGKDEADYSDLEMLRKFETPYLIWANYDVDLTDVPDLLSVNFFMPYIMKAAGMNLDGYPAYLYALSRIYPVVANNGILDADGAFYRYESNSECYEAIHDYEIVQYYRMKK